LAGCRLSRTFCGRAEIRCLVHRSLMFPLVTILATCIPAPVLVQRPPFERTFELSEPAILDVSTIRGQSGRVSPQGRPASWARRSKDPHRNETWPAPYAAAVRSCVSSAAAAPFASPSPRTAIRQLHLPPLLCGIETAGSSNARPLSVDRPRTVVPYSPSERLTSPCDRCDDLSDTRRTEALQEAVRARPHA
jgi:hypothetical protein